MTSFLDGPYDKGALSSLICKDEGASGDSLYPPLMFCHHTRPTEVLSQGGGKWTTKVLSISIHYWTYAVSLTFVRGELKFGWGLISNAKEAGYLNNICICGEEVVRYLEYILRSAERRDC